VDFGQRELDEFRRPIGTLSANTRRTRHTLTYTNETDPALYEGKCPENKVTYSAPPVCQVDAGKGTYGPSTNFTSQNDFAQMRVSPPPPTHSD
jgi:hypothetical protein